MILYFRTSDCITGMFIIKKTQLSFQMTSNILGVYIPDEILSRIFCEYLSIEDFSRFDIAISNKTRRNIFFAFIGSESCIFNGGKNKKSNFMMWVMLRCIELRELNCRNLKGLTLTARDLSSSRHNSDFSITDSFPNLTVINLLVSKEITDTSIVRVVECCPNLQRLRLSSCKKITIV
jgi:hypothetical protein